MPKTSEHDKASSDQLKFLGMISHELKTPLNAIIGFSDMIEGQIFGEVGAPEYLEFAKEIQQSGRRLLGVINELLAASSAQLGDMDKVESHVDLARVLGDAIETFRPLAAQKTQSIELEGERALAGLWADDRAVRQALASIVDNAIKFTPNGGAIRIALRLADDGDVLIRVSDDGPGFGDHTIDEMTAIFHQADGSVAREYEGVGVGLYLCQRLMRLNDGAVEIANREEGGAAVTLRFPKDRRIDVRDEDDLTVMDDEDEGAEGAVLELTYEGRTMHVFASGEAFVMGRVDQRPDRNVSNLTVSDRRASRPHAQIISADGAFFVVDESRRGTYVAVDGAPPELVHLSVSPPLEGEGVIALGDMPDADGVALIRYRARNGGGTE